MISVMCGLFDGTPLERPVTCAICAEPVDRCDCPRGNDGTPVRPKDRVIKVTIEKRRRGKTVTVLTGLDLAADEMASLLRRLKSACAAGGTVDGGSIEIQGAHAEKLTAVLAELGYTCRST